MTSWTRAARNDLESALAYIAWDDPDAAVRMARRIRETTKRLPLFPEIGRAGRVPGTRELIIAKSPFVVIYRIASDGIQILRLLHTAMKWPSSHPRS